MDNQDLFSRWATVEMFGKKGETYEQVVSRISAERVSHPVNLQNWSFASLDWCEPVEPAEPSSGEAEYRWKKPRELESTRQARKRATKVSRETSRSVSVVKTKIKEVPVKKAGDEGKPLVESRADAIALFTRRQEELAMQILLGKE